jgi:copper transport protein
MRAIRWATCAVLVLLCVVGAAAPAMAHAELIDTDPRPGAVVDTLPDVVTYTFNEHVSQVPGGVHVYDARGGELDSSASARDDDLLVTIDSPVTSGTVVVAWRVVSADGHPIAGTLTFSVGAPSENAVAPPDSGTPRAVSVALSLSRWPAYAGLLVAVGLVWFVALLLPPQLDRHSGVVRRMLSTARWAAVVSVAAWTVGLLVDAAYLRGTGFSTLPERETLDALPGREVVAVAVIVAGLGVAVLTRGTAASTGALVALVPVALVGHSVAMSHARLNVVVDGFHLVAGATWLGGLTGLVLLLRGTSAQSDVAVAAVARFSAAAASVLTALVLAGSVLAWQLVGGWDGLVDSGYGQVLLAKIALALAAVAVAAYNRFRLVPVAATARRTLTRTIGAEVAILLAVVLVTGFLVQKNPPSGVGTATAASVEPLSGRADLGGLQTVVTLAPGVIGSNTVTVEIENSSGAPAELFTPPELRVLGDQVSVGDVVLQPVSLGTYEGTVDLPVGGSWRFQVAVRVDEFTNPVATVELTVDH